jgi:NTP pyrophosphatase (non-canonical NTP hydrolase)
MQIDLKKYTEFVKAITSRDSESATDFTQRIYQIDLDGNLNISLALTAAMGMSGEAGEFSEIFKKILFHGKPFTEETRAHCAKELGDVIWYWTNACRALNLDPNQIIADNVTKLESRYPGGKFSVDASENRAQGDI